MGGKLGPAACTASIVHDLAEMPSTCTTQAPHCDVSHPTWVPVSRRSSRKNCTRSVRGSMFPVTALPFTVIATAAMTILLRNQADDLVCAASGGGRMG